MPAHLISLAKSLVSHIGTLPLAPELDDALDALVEDADEDDDEPPLSFFAPDPSGTVRPPLSEEPLELPPDDPSSTEVVDSAHATSAATPPEMETRANTAVGTSFARMEHP